jgi:hypothetical protein
MPRAHPNALADALRWVWFGYRRKLYRTCMTITAETAGASSPARVGGVGSPEAPGAIRMLAGFTSLWRMPMRCPAVSASMRMASGSAISFIATSQASSSSQASHTGPCRPRRACAAAGAAR